MNFRKCCIIYNQPRENALADELDVLVQVEFIESNLKKLGIETYRKGITTDFMKETALLSEEKPEFVFNLVESINNKGELCYFIPALLNMYSLPYTGNPVEAMFITTSKELTGRTLKSAGINNPGGFLPSQRDKLVPGKRYIIKPIWEDGSMGITAESVFTFTPEYGKKLLEYKDSHWLVEDYIEGREFNVTVVASESGPEVLPPAEIIFRGYDENMPRIVDFKAKWEEGSFEYENTVRDFPGEKLDPLLKQRIIETALRCWDVFGLRGYARVDMRVDRNDIPFVIEVNANPCLSPDSGVIAALAAAGLPVTEFIRRVINDIHI